jgi:DHA3 family macrolide efflux protein-like MFS transporter
VSSTPWSPRVAGFLAAEAVSAIGSFATMVVIWGYAAYEFDASATEVSLFGLAFSIPGVLLGPLTGTIVDRVGPKATLAASKVIGIAASLLLLGAGDFVSMALLSALHGVASAFAHPAIQSMPPRLVEDRHLARTNALVSLTDELAIVLGPAAAGFAIAVFGFRGAFVFDALTYALGLVVLPMVRLRKVEVALDEPPVRFRDALEGWKIVRRTPVLRRIVLCTATVFSLYGLALLAEPLYVRDVLERSEAVFASLQTAFGVCLVAGGLVAARFGERVATFRFVALGVAASGVAAMLYLGTPSIHLAVTGVMFWGVATSAISGPSRTVLQRNAPERAHGRVMATDMLAGNAAMLTGTAVCGPLVGAFGVPWSVAGMGTFALVVGLLVLRKADEDQAGRQRGSRMSSPSELVRSSQ